MEGQSSNHILLSLSFLPVELVIHNFDSLHQFLRTFIFYPLPKSTKLEFALLLPCLQPLEVVREYFIPIFFLKDAIDEMAAEKTQFYLTSLEYLLAHGPMGF